MSRARRDFSSIAFCVLLCGALPRARGRALRRWSAAPRSSIPLALRELDQRTISVSTACCCRSDRRMSRSPTATLFALPSMAPVRAGARRRVRPLRRAAQGEPAERDASASAKAFDFQLFDRALLYSPDTRFVLAGIVNRMDRAYVCRSKLRRDPADLPPDADRTCRTGDDAASPRLPMTLNVVLKAKGDQAMRRQRSPAPRSRGAGSTPAIAAGGTTGGN